VPRSCSLTTRQQTTLAVVGTFRVLAWRIIGGVEWCELRQMQIWVIDSASIFATHCRQTEANFQYFYGTNSPSLLLTSLSSSHSSQTPRQLQSSPVLHAHSNLHLISLRCGITEHLRGRRACFFPPRISIKVADTYSSPPGVHPLYHHPKSLSKPQRPEEFSNPLGI
jgi:hypothetical protein